MPGKDLPTFTRTDVQSHKTLKSCYVTIGNKVFDITDFLEDHPGGGALILEYGGKDIKDILADEVSHTHTDTAYEILDEHLVGFLADGASGTAIKSKPDAIPPVQLDENGKAVFATTGMASEEDLTKDTNTTDDYKKYKFLDLSKPLLMQVWFGGFTKDFYLEQVHRPRHYPGGASAPIFGNFLEPLSLTPWYVVPMVWLPCIAYGVYRALEGLSPTVTALSWVSGLLIWTFVEYMLHRFLFHLDEWLPDNRVGLTLHFLLHGIHHYLPMDKYRLVMPPTLFLALAIPWWKFAHTVFWFNWHMGTAVFCGAIFGYVCYDLTHYFLHHKNLPMHYKALKKYHLQHHFADYQNGFGVTSRFWDDVFGTALKVPPPEVLKTT
ncbi:Inositolphosphorylceramide-B hydroxylase [Trichodelitschia bisporula]|uniref:Ceramide very long chain fatty acid hydroxylase n=1 Tax=Trichodelitschia bisporula TaxID=703511 RepID=A0A6G1HKI0_9PEZI|nr:Inositolphosphorylceramide-B hydroxylase [Trichodelitschia bisporula]